MGTKRGRICVKYTIRRRFKDREERGEEKTNEENAIHAAVCADGAAAGGIVRKQRNIGGKRNRYGNDHDADRTECKLDGSGNRQGRKNNVQGVMPQTEKSSVPGRHAGLMPRRFGKP